MTLDVLVVGAGRAGAIASGTLAAAGWRVAMLDRCVDGRRPVGESLSGVALTLLRSAGLAPDEGHGRLTGTVSSWGADGTHREDFLNSPFGSGLRLDRRRFDAGLVRAAVERGARLLRGRFRTMRPLDGGQAVTTATGRTLAARWVVDASGRAGVVARRAGAARHCASPLLSVSACVPAVGDSSRTVVEATTEGWWYATHIGDGRAIASIQCDKALAKLMRSEPDRWRAHVSRSALIARHVQPVGDLRLDVGDASATRADVRHGPGWLALGDAAAAWDPVTSHGLYAAIRDGLDGAAAISSALAGDDGALVRFDTDRADRYAFVDRQTRAAYARETRWPDAPFWASRHDGIGRHDDLRGHRRCA